MVKSEVYILTEFQCRIIEDKKRRKKINEIYAVQYYSNGEIDKESLEFIKCEGNREQIEKVLCDYDEIIENTIK